MPNHPKDGQRHGGAAGSACKSRLVLVLLAGNPGTRLTSRRPYFWDECSRTFEKPAISRCPFAKMLGKSGLQQIRVYVKMSTRECSLS